MKTPEEEAQAIVDKITFIDSDFANRVASDITAALKAREAERGADGYESPLRRALNKVTDVNVEASINFLNQISPNTDNSSLAHLKAFREHLDKRIAELEGNDIAAQQKGSE